MHNCFSIETNHEQACEMSMLEGIKACCIFEYGRIGSSSLELKSVRLKVHRHFDLHTLSLPLFQTLRYNNHLTSLKSISRFSITFPTIGYERCLEGKCLMFRVYRMIWCTCYRSYINMRQGYNHRRFHSLPLGISLYTHLDSILVSFVYRVSQQ